MKFAAASGTDLDRKVPTKLHRTSFLMWCRHRNNHYCRLPTCCNGHQGQRSTSSIKSSQMKPDADFTSLETVFIPESMTKHHEQNTLLGVGGEGAQLVYIFGCREHLAFFAQTECFIAGGTFGSAPNLFLQNYSFMSHVRGFNVVVLDCPLPSKTNVVYDTMFDIIEEPLPGNSKLSCSQLQGWISIF